MNSKDTETLATMYNLFERVNGIKVLCNAFRMHIQVNLNFAPTKYNDTDILQTTVQDIVTDTAKDEDMVQRLLDFKALADTTTSSSFLDEKININRANGSSSTSSRIIKIPNSDFVYALSDAFTMGFKARRSTPAEMIAKYLDKAMRRGQGGTSDERFEAYLDSVLALYRFTDDKDVFRSFYHRSLAKRLLLQKSASDDFEASMLKKLKERKSFGVLDIVVLRRA
jgi:cullin 4